eukprot:scaffold22.g6089.t1
MQLAGDGGGRMPLGEYAAALEDSSTAAALAPGLAGYRLREATLRFQQGGVATARRTTQASGRWVRAHGARPTLATCHPLPVSVSPLSRSLPLRANMSNRDDESISFLSDSGSRGDEPSQLPQLGQASSAALQPDASLWDEVDTEELERIARAVASNAIPPAETAEVGPARLLAAPLPDWDSVDPLGLGHLDPRTLTLGTGEAPATAGGKGSRPGRVSISEGGSGRRSSLFRRAGEDAGRADAGAALRSRVLPSSEAFSPTAYLGVVHRETQLNDLVSGLQSLRAQLSEHTGQLKSLVKENFDRFISSKDTIDDIHLKLRKAETAGDTADGTSTGEVAEAVQAVRVDARHAFGGLLDRQAKAERVKVVLGALQQYEAMVQLPAKVRKHVEAGDQEQAREGRRGSMSNEERGEGCRGSPPCWPERQCVRRWRCGLRRVSALADYRKAKALLHGASGGAGGRARRGEGRRAASRALSAPRVPNVSRSLAGGAPRIGGGGAGAPGSAAMEGSSLWPRLMADIEKAMAALTYALEAELRSPACGVAEAAAAMRRLLELQAGGVQAAASIDPVRRVPGNFGLLTYFVAQEQHMVDALKALRQDGAVREPRRKSSQEASPGGPASLGPAATAGAVAGAAAGQAAALLQGEGDSSALACVTSATATLLSWLPAFWALVEQQLPQLAAAGLPQAGPVDATLPAAEQVVARVLSEYRSTVAHALEGDAGAGPAPLLDAAADIADAALALEEEGCPAQAVAALQQLAQQACTQSMASLQQCALQEARRLSSPAGWRALAPATDAGGGGASAAASAADGSAAELAQSVVDQLSAVAGLVLQQAVRLVAAVRLRFRPPLHDLLVGLFHAASAEMDGAAAAAMQALQTEATVGAARAQLLPRLGWRWGGALAAHGLAAAQAAADVELEVAEGRLITSYVALIQAELDRAVEELLALSGPLLPPAAVVSGAAHVALLLTAAKGEMAGSLPQETVQEVAQELAAGVLEGLENVGRRDVLPWLPPFRAALGVRAGAGGERGAG